MQSSQVLCYLCHKLNKSGQETHKRCRAALSMELSRLKGEYFNFLMEQKRPITFYPRISDDVAFANSSVFTMKITEGRIRSNVAKETGVSLQGIKSIDE